MRLEQLESGASVFIDANIFIYHFTGVSEQSTVFLRRCEEGDLHGMTSVIVLLEVLHRLMMIEAVKKGLARPPQILKKLQKNPKKIQSLSEYFRGALTIPDMGIQVRPVLYEMILKSQTFRAGYGLMVHDSLIVAAMEEEGIRLLATNDSAFSKVNGISVHRPTDIHGS